MIENIEQLIERLKQYHGGDDGIQSSFLKRFPASQEYINQLYEKEKEFIKSLNQTFSYSP